MLICQELTPAMDKGEGKLEPHFIELAVVLSANLLP
jgi:hypothetical protein